MIEEVIPVKEELEPVPFVYLGSDNVMKGFSAAYTPDFRDVILFHQGERCMFIYCETSSPTDLQLAFERHLEVCHFRVKLKKKCFNIDEDI